MPTKMYAFVAGMDFTFCYLST